ncbi:MAG: hypothetical protein ACLFU4_06590 [Opitutales bacterium]
MKRYHFLLFLALPVFFLGCAGTGGSSSSESDEAAGTGDEQAEVNQTGAKTAYEGSTGSGLLMERYKSGSIQGLND